MKNNSKSVMECQRRKKITAVEHFGGQCQRCGYNKCINALEFHHLEKSEKEESPSYIIMRWSWKRAMKELDKCVLLCANCHREAHYYPEINIDLKKVNKPYIQLICPYCSNTFSTKNYKQKYCSQSCACLDQRKVIRPSANELKVLIDRKISWTRLGQMFGVSDNAVRKWAKSYKLLI